MPDPASLHPRHRILYQQARDETAKLISLIRANADQNEIDRQITVALRANQRWEATIAPADTHQWMERLF